MLRSRILLGATAVALAATATACGSSSPTAAPSSSPSPTTTTRTAAELTAGLLVASDLPAGYTAKPVDHRGDPVGSSSDPSCADLVTLFNLRHAPGSLAQAETDLEPGDQGPNSVNESLDSLGTSANVAALLQRISKAAAGCSHLTLTDPTSKQSIDVAIGPAPAPSAGTGGVAFTLNIAGFKGVQIFTGVGDTVLTIGIPQAMDVNGLLAKAVQKAQTSLGVK